MSVIKRGFSALGKLGIIVIIGAAFLAGLLGTIYYSLRSKEVNVPNIVGKDVLEGERALDQDGLYMRRRAERYSPNSKPNTILDQSPHAGEIIKVGQTVAVVVSRASAKEGEESVLGNSDGNSAVDGSNTNAEANTSKPADENSNKDKANKNTRNKNSNNSNNANNTNANRKANANNANNANNRNGVDRNTNNRNSNNGNANSNRGTTNSNRNGNSGARNANTATNRRPPAAPTPSSTQNRNRRVP